MSSVSNELDQPRQVSEELIVAARKGCQKSLGELAERYRRYLLHVANDSLNPALRAKVCAFGSGARGDARGPQEFSHVRRGQRSGTSRLAASYRLLSALQAARRYFGTASRDPRCEISMDGSQTIPQELMTGSRHHALHGTS